jgi:hypothetical protein
MPGDGTLPKPVWSPRKFAASDIVTLNVRDVLPAERFGVRILTLRQLWMEIGHGPDQ